MIKTPFFKTAKRLSVLLLTGCLLGGMMISCGFVEFRDYSDTSEGKETTPPKETIAETDAPPESETWERLPETSVSEPSVSETSVSETSVPEISVPEISGAETDAAETEIPETAPMPVLVTRLSLPFHSVTLAEGSTVTPKATLGPEDAEDFSVHWESSDPAVAEVDEKGTILARSAGECTVKVSVAGNPALWDSISVKVERAPACTYIDGILIANKTYALPETYALGVDGEAYEKLLTMFSEAAKDGISLTLISGYRSYEHQYTLYYNYIARDGQAAADRYSARPGHSEHQSGLAFDLNSLYQSFGDTAEGLWLAENCHRFGFIIRYPKEKEHITGYMYEPWHVRYVGEKMAEKIKNSGLCLEEFFGITSEYAAE